MTIPFPSARARTSCWCLLPNALVTSGEPPPERSENDDRPLQPVGNHCPDQPGVVVIHASAPVAIKYSRSAAGARGELSPKVRKKPVTRWIEGSRFELHDLLLQVVPPADSLTLLAHRRVRVDRRYGCPKVTPRSHLGLRGNGDLSAEVPTSVTAARASHYRRLGGRAPNGRPTVEADIAGVAHRSVWLTIMRSAAARNIVRGNACQPRPRILQDRRRRLLRDVPMDARDAGLNREEPSAQRVPSRDTRPPNRGRAARSAAARGARDGGVLVIRGTEDDDSS
jgi:hypothetical protein